MVRELQELRAEVRALRESRSVVEPLTLDVDEAAKMLGCGRTTVFNLLNRGELIAAPKAGRTRMITRESVEAYQLSGPKPKKARMARAPTRSPRTTASAEDVQARVMELLR